ncbi:MAG TPA: AIPR family protein [Sediminibacterium sp.]|uniref:AIPR family protein n=1 Tax=Sediminibacterium sp. TaxID=1917865 RepID=UPI002C20799B|nr:AIPR family protein [Sediminibacterium sp.]HQS23207.1 AIPR family protein [Sediminibacterium sp.]
MSFNFISTRPYSEITYQEENMSSLIKNQIEEDILIIQENWGYLDNNLKKKEYAFNYWVLSRLYDIDEELIPEMVTDYNDKSIDCFVHYPDSKELFIIQNKYYSEDTLLKRNDVSDFLVSPLVSLNDNKYTRSKELQKIYNSIKDDSEYKIHLHFFVSNNKRSMDADYAIKNFNTTPPVKISPFLRSSIFYLDDIKNLYYGESFKDDITFNYSIKTKVKSNTLRILPEEHDMPDMSKAYFVLTPVYQLFEMYKSSISKNYKLFEDNIREYLGKNSINTGIINTLKDKNDRANFFYYNNGITIICSKIDTSTPNTLKLIQPQIVNGCQTVNSIYEVLNDCPDKDLMEEFKQTFVMVKILLFDEKTKIQKGDKFYKDIVKFNNKQNSINENAFGAKKKVFEKMQSEFENRGFLLMVKPSDKNKFKEKYSSDSELNQITAISNKYTEKIGLSAKSLSDILIPLDKLIQVYMAFVKDEQFAYNKKNAVLNQTSDIYKDYSLKMVETLTHDNLIRLYLIYLKAEKRRAASDDKKTPIPYYLVGFLGRFIKNKKKQNTTLNELFESNNKVFAKLFDYLEKLTNRYKKSYIDSLSSEYNMMIKKPIDEKVLSKEIDILNDIIVDSDAELKKYFESLY